MRKNGKLLVVCLAVATSLAFAGCGKETQNREADLAKVTSENNQLQDRITELEQDLKAANDRANAAEQSLVGTTEDESYMQMKFPSDGNYYKEAYDEIKFYSDVTCTQPIKDARFMSAEIDTGVATNGLQVYALRLDSGKICYCSQNEGRPYLVTEQCYNELKAEQAEEEAASEEE